LAGDVITFGDDDASANRSIVERRANGLEIVGEAGIVRLETIRTVEAELSRVEVRVGLRLIFTRKLKFTRPY